jgi:hypothetical protein
VLSPRTGTRKLQVVNQGGVIEQQSVAPGDSSSDDDDADDTDRKGIRPVAWSRRPVLLLLLVLVLGLVCLNEQSQLATLTALVMHGTHKTLHFRKRATVHPLPAAVVAAMDSKRAAQRASAFLKRNINGIAGRETLRERDNRLRAEGSSLRTVRDVVEGSDAAGVGVRVIRSGVVEAGALPGGARSWCDGLSAARVGIVTVASGTRAWDSLVLQSMGASKHLIDFIVIGTSKDFLAAAQSLPLPPNVKIVPADAHDLARRIASAWRKESGVPFEWDGKPLREADIAAWLQDGHRALTKTMDFMPMIGAVFKPELEHCTHWGWTAMDTVFGRLDRVLTMKALTRFDIVTFLTTGGVRGSTTSGKFPLYLSAGLTVLKNVRKHQSQVWNFALAPKARDQKLLLSPRAQEYAERFAVKSAVGWERTPPAGHRHPKHGSSVLFDFSSVEQAETAHRSTSFDPKTGRLVTSRITFGAVTGSATECRHSIWSVQSGVDALAGEHGCAYSHAGMKDVWRAGMKDIWRCVPLAGPGFSYVWDRSHGLARGMHGAYQLSAEVDEAFFKSKGITEAVYCDGQKDVVDVEVPLVRLSPAWRSLWRSNGPKLTQAWLHLVKSSKPWWISHKQAPAQVMTEPGGGITGQAPQSWKNLNLEE